MLEGTELYDAYSPLIGSAEAAFEETNRKQDDKVNAQQQNYSSNIVYDELNTIQKATNRHYGYGGPQQPSQRQSTQVVKQTQQPPLKLQQPAIHQQVPQPAQMDVSLFNKQFEQEQKIAILMNELKKRPSNAPIANNQQQYIPDDSYWDKMTNKKKDIVKYIQSSMIILFAISLHYLVDFLLKIYLETHNVSFKREVIIRMLYPLGIVFIAWNIIVFYR